MTDSKPTAVSGDTADHGASPKPTVSEETKRRWPANRLTVADPVEPRASPRCTRPTDLPPPSGCSAASPAAKRHHGIRTCATR